MLAIKASVVNKPYPVNLLITCTVTFFLRREIYRELSLWKRAVGQGEREYWMYMFSKAIFQYEQLKPHFYRITYLIYLFKIIK